MIRRYRILRTLARKRVFVSMCLTLIVGHLTGHLPYLNNEQPEEIEVQLFFTIDD
jgi:hypothetical protein